MERNRLHASAVGCRPHEPWSIAPAENGDGSLTTVPESESGEDGFNNVATARSPDVQTRIATRVASDRYLFADPQWSAHGLRHSWQ